MSSKYELSFIEDLDRVPDKKSVKIFLKELYRFQNSVSKEVKEQFVFIVAIKPEALLLAPSEKSRPFEHLYSKVFDVTINLKPIHFADYVWDDHKTHKKQFNVAWNKVWKPTLGKLDNHLL